MALAMLAAACDGELMAGLPKQTVNIPITGGLDTKTGPLAQAPGTFLQLDDVRQERRHEWRNRQGITHADALDDLSQPPLRLAELPGGGAFGFHAGGTNANAGIVYSRNVPSTAARWTNLGTGSSQARPSYWARTDIGSEPGNLIGQQMVSQAIGNGFRMVAWKAALPATTIRVRISSLTDGTVVYSADVFGVTTASNPRCVYENAAKVFLMFWADGANLNVAKWNANTGALVSGSTTLKTNVAATGQFIDTWWYSGATVTVVYRNAATNAHQLEVNPTTLVLATDVDLGVNCDNSLQLLQDPDGGTTRFVALCTSVPAVRVLRTTSAGAVSTNDVAAAATSSTQIAGVAYQAGASWMIVFLDRTTNQLRAVKKFTGSVGAVLDLDINYGLSEFVHVLNSNAWREPGTDTMRYMGGIHRGSFAAVPDDFQATYFEMALEYDNGSDTIGNRYTEPQARILPLNAGYRPASGNLPQVTRTTTNTFSVPLSRLATPTIASGVVGHEYSVDAWTQEILSTSSRPNLGPGIIGPTVSYLPAGSLQQSGTGQRIFSHGHGTIPFKPTVVAAVGTSLLDGAMYQWVITTEDYDEFGNVWESAPSIASNAAAFTGANRAATITVRLSSLENALRFRTVKLWRTLGNGALIGADGEYLVQLVAQTTKLCDPTNSMFTFTDTTSDASLALSDFITPGLKSIPTPAFNHVAFFDGRMWGAERDFPSRLRYAKIMEQGRQPEFPGEFFKDIIDEEGPITGIAALDDKLIVGKASAIYFISAGGPANNGTGGQYTVVKVNSEFGFELGAPYLSTGSHVWFSHDGPKRIDRSLHIEDIGAPIERYFIRPLIQTPETAVSITFNSLRSEIRLLTTNYRFVFDMETEQWIRDTGAPAGATATLRLSDVGDMFFRSNGQVWWDYDVENASSTADASGAIRGVMRSPWVRAAAPEGYFRIYKARTLWKIEAAGALTSWPETSTYFNDNDAIVETDVPTGTSGTTKQTIEARAARGKCTSFSLGVRLPAGNLTWRISQWSVLLALKKAMHADSPAALGRGG